MNDKAAHKYLVLKSILDLISSLTFDNRWSTLDYVSLRLLIFEKKVWLYFWEIKIRQENF